MRWISYPTRADWQHREHGTPRTGAIIAPAPEHGRRWVKPTDGGDSRPVKVQVHRDEDRNYSLGDW
jgi:hypothetical protein